jgi:alkaline phosphatase
MLRLFAAFCTVLMLGCRANRTPEPDYARLQFSGRPKNVILLIGDGMGLAQVSAQVYWSGKKTSIFQQFPYVGLHKSH